MGETPISSSAVRRRARRRQPSCERRGPPASPAGRARLDMAADSTSAPPPRDRVEPPGGSAANPKRTPPHACGGVHLRVAARADAAARGSCCCSSCCCSSCFCSGCCCSRPTTKNGSSHAATCVWELAPHSHQLTWRILLRIRPYFQKRSLRTVFYVF